MIFTLFNSLKIYKINMNDEKITKINTIFQDISKNHSTFDILKKEKEKNLNLISFSYIFDFKPKQSHNNNECDNTPCIIGLTHCRNLESSSSQLTTYYMIISNKVTEKKEIHSKNQKH